MAQKKTGGSKKMDAKRKARQKSGGKVSAKKPAARSSGKASVKTPTHKTEQNESRNIVITTIVLLVIAVVIGISNFGKGGSIGGAISTFFFGMFGILSYVFPILLFILPIFVLVNRSAGKKTYRTAMQKVIAVILVFVFLCVFAFLVHSGDSNPSFISVYKESGYTKVGGGLIGALIGKGFMKAFSLLIAYVLDIIILVLSVLLFMGNEFMESIIERFADRADARQELRDMKRMQDRELRKQAHQEDLERQKMMRAEQLVRRRTAPLPEVGPGTDGPKASKKIEEERIPRRTRKVSGVAMDTKIEAAEGTKPSEKISEIDMKAVGVSNNKESMEDRLMEEALKEEEVTSQQSDAFWNRPLPNIITNAAHKAKPAVHEHDEVEELQMEQTEEQPTEKRARNPKQSKEEVEAGISAVDEAIAANEEPVKEYVFPNINLLKRGGSSAMGDSVQHLKEMSEKLQLTLDNFGVNARVTNVISGPAVTQYEIQPEMGVKVSKIVNLQDDIKLNLAVPDIRIEAPIPGKAAIGIEVPNKEVVSVPFRTLIESSEFQKHESNISFCAGKDIAGNVIVADIAKMPHVLIAGATGSGKSVCINTIIMSILYKAKPEDVKLIMIDPKVVELSVYNGIPHLLIPVVTDPKQAAGALHWAVAEMTDRYAKFSEYGVRDIKGYNKKVESIKDIQDENKPKKMPQIVVIVDELADLMMVAPGDVEDAICRLAQLARAAGIHLIIATQRPSVNVITGLIKANMPSRIAFSVTSGVDSRTILDMNGAEKLLGKGDMLFYPQGFAKPLRVQGAFVSDGEVADVVSFIIENNGKSAGDKAVTERMNSMKAEALEGSGFTASANDRDSYFAEAGRFIIEKEKGSIGMLQRMFRIGFNRAARIMDQLEEAGVVGPEEGTKPRRVLMTLEEFDAVCEEMD